ncbi:glycosyltransferase, partial [Bifidobacterium pseudolongum]
MVDEATERCISSIRSSCKGYNYAIVVVDNNSSNGSYGSLLSKYGKDNDIIFIHNENNMGFARGNNIGYEYCRNKLKCDYIVTINNDARIIDDNIIPKVVADYERTGCGVIGPHILSEKTHKS